MSTYVVDASVAAKWFVQEEHTATARSLLDKGDDLHVPDIFLVETDSIVCKWVRRGIMTAVDGGGIRASIRGTSLEFHPFGPLLDSAYAIAVETGRGIYDCRKRSRRRNGRTASTAKTPRTPRTAGGG